jgi:hypothetical protein
MEAELIPVEETNVAEEKEAWETKKARVEANYLK